MVVAIRLLPHWRVKRWSLNNMSKNLEELLAWAKEGYWAMLREKEAAEWNQECSFA